MDMLIRLVAAADRRRSDWSMERQDVIGVANVVALFIDSV
jgi:hypothetical protein